MFFIKDGLHFARAAQSDATASRAAAHARQSVANLGHDRFDRPPHGLGFDQGAFPLRQVNGLDARFCALTLQADAVQLIP